jgi:hypothetical protein
MSSYSRLIRFFPKASKSPGPLVGEPTDPGQDVGLASYESKSIEVEVFSGGSILNPGNRTGEKVFVDRLLSPLAENEVGTIRCIGLNVGLPIFAPAHSSISDMPRRSIYRSQMFPCFS